MSGARDRAGHTTRIPVRWALGSVLIGVLAIAMPAAAADVLISDFHAGFPAGHDVVPLAGTTTQIGDKIWDASAGVGRSGTTATNIGSDIDLMATVPLDPSQYPGYTSFAIEARVDASAMNWVNVGFMAQPASPTWSQPHISIQLKSTGRITIKVRDDALLNHTLYAGPTPDPAYLGGGLDRLKLEYDVTENSLRAWLNDAELPISAPDLDDIGFTPSLMNAGFHANASTALPEPELFALNDLTISAGGGPLTVTQQPASMAVQRSYPAAFHAEVSGGVEPLVYQWWKKRATCIPPACWDPVVNTNLVSGSTTDTLSFAGVAASHDGTYMLTVDDSGDPLQHVESDEVQLAVYNAVPGCTVGEPALADFSLPEAEWEWVDDDTLTRWRKAGNTAEFQTGDAFPCGGAIRTQNEVFVPEGYDTIIVEFQGIDFMGTSQTLQAELSWDGGAGSKTFTAQHDTTLVEIDLSDQPSWHDGDLINGFRPHTLQIDFNTCRVRGYIRRIDIKSNAPYLVFSGDPRLYLGDDPVTPEIGYAAGTQMQLHQWVRNDGCDMAFDDAPEEREITYSLCQTDHPETCYDGFDSSACNDGQIRINGPLDNNEGYEYRWCPITLPPAEPANYVNWTLTGRFDNDPTKQVSTLVFPLVEHGRPNLWIENQYVSVEALYEGPEGWQRASWVSAALPFRLTFTVVSDYYPADPVVGRVYARLHPPGVTLPDDDWEHFVLDVPIGLVDGVADVEVDSVDLAQLLTAGESWGLVDLKLVLDPDSQIPETNESDNGLVVPSWIVLAANDIHTDVGEYLWGTEFDPAALLPEASSGLDVWLMRGPPTQTGSMGMRYDGSPSGWDPFIWFEGCSWKMPSGIMVRYRRNKAGGIQYFAAEVLDEAPSPNEPPPDLTASRVSFGPNPYQWQVMLWKRSDLPPFNYPNITEMAVENPDGPGHTLRLVTDKSNLNGIYPTTELDHVFLWGDTPDDPPAQWDARPAGLLYLDESTQPPAWQPVPSPVAAGSSLRLGLAVQLTGADSPPAEQLTNDTTVDRLEPDDPIAKTMIATAPIDLGDGRWLYPLLDNDDGLYWDAAVPGTTFFEATEDVDDLVLGNNDATYQVEVVDSTLGLIYRPYDPDNPDPVPWDYLPPSAALGFDWELALTVDIEGMAEPPALVTVTRSTDGMQLLGNQPTPIEPNLYLYLLRDTADSTLWHPDTPGAVTFEATVPAPYNRTRTFAIELFETHACPVSVDLP